MPSAGRGFLFAVTFPILLFRIPPAVETCEVNVSYSYFDYVMEAVCEARCPVAFLLEMSFRDDLWATTVPVDGREKIQQLFRGSFWGESLQCTVDEYAVICTVVIEVNTTVSFTCLDRNGRWPPFEMITVPPYSEPGVVTSDARGGDDPRVSWFQTSPLPVTSWVVTVPAAVLWFVILATFFRERLRRCLERMRSITYREPRRRARVLYSRATEVDDHYVYQL